MGVSAGRVLLIPKGDWNAQTTYTGLDWVRHNGAAWVCKNTCTGIEPTEANSANWQIMSRDGSQITVDAEISNTSENPVQNKVIKKYVDEHTPEIADMTGATSTQNGAHGLVPAPQMGDEKKALLGDGTWGSVDAILTFKTKDEYDAAVANDEIPDGAKVIKEYNDGGSTAIIDVDTVMSDTSENPVQNKVIKKYVDEKQVNIDGVTLTLDEARNVIKLADTLKDKIGTALQPESIVNNLTTTEAGFALDARQANPNVDGTLAKQVSDLNGSLNLYCEAIMTPNYAYSEEFTWKFYKCGRIVTVITNSLRDIPTGAELVLFDSIPNEFIPMVNVGFRMYDLNTKAVVEVAFYTSGKVLVRNYTGNASSGYNIGGNILYVSKEI